jgi:hypothetical protein
LRTTTGFVFPIRATRRRNSRGSAKDRAAWIVLGEVGEEVVLGQAGSIPEVDEPGNAEAGVLEALEERLPQGATLRDERDLPARGEPPREGGVQLHAFGAVDDPHAVRADDLQVVAVDQRAELLFEPRPFSAALLEPGRDDDEMNDPLPTAFLDRAQDDVPVDRENRQVDVRRQLADFRGTREAEHLGVLRVDRMEASAVAAVLEVLEDRSRDRPGFRARTDNGDRPRCEETPQILSHPPPSPARSAKRAPP